MTIISGNQVDLVGDQIPIEELRSMEADPLPVISYITVQHDWAIHPIGRTLATKLHLDDKTGEAKLYSVSALYALQDLPTWSVLGLNLDLAMSARSSYEDIDGQEIADVVLRCDPRAWPSGFVESFVEGAPSVVKKQPELVLRKSLVEIPLLAIVISGAYAFSKGFGERLGDRAADGLARVSSDIYDWLKARISEQFDGESIPDSKLFIQIDSDGCDIRVLIPTDNSTTTSEAVASIDEAMELSLRVIEVLKPKQIQRLVIVFDRESAAWKPKFAACTDGTIVVDKPVTVDFDSFGGMSIEASARIAEID